MIAVDTNLLVRLATNDDAGAREAVVRLLDRSEVFVAKTVLLECEWVLRSRFDYPPAQVSRFLRYLLSLPQVQVEDEIAVLQAMKLLELDEALCPRVGPTRTIRRTFSYPAHLVPNIAVPDGTKAGLFRSFCLLPLPQTGCPQK